jgi:hypothetical protein
MSRAEPLRAQIDAAEQRLAQNRTRLRADVRGIAETLRARLVAPSSIAAAVAVGVIIEQGSRDRTWSLASMLEGMSVATRLAVMLGSLVQSLGVASGSETV